MFCLPDVRGEVWSATGHGFSLLFGRKSDSVTNLTEKIRINSCQQRQVQHKFIAGSLEAAYSLNWGPRKIWGKGGGETLALL